MRARIRAWLESRRIVAWSIACAVVVALPTLGLGLLLDDHWHRVYLLRHGRFAIAAKPALDLFTFYDGDPARTHRLVDLGVAPWWTDPSVRISFFRPLSALTHWLDERLWPGSPAAMHLHSIAWYAALVAAATTLYRRLAPSKLAAGLAALMFAMDYAHGLPVGWVANRNALVAASFGLLSVLLHDRGRRDGEVLSRRLAPLVLLAALFSGEVALGALGYLIAHALFLDPASERGDERAATALRALAPYAPTVAIWAVAYRFGGYGVRGSDMYLDPAAAPLSFVGAAFAHLPVLLAGELGAPFADFYGVSPLVVRVAIVACSTLVVVLGAVVLAPLLRRSAPARFFAAGGALSVLPACATVPSLRLLLLPSFGLLGLVASLAAALVDRDAWLATAPARRLRNGFALYVAGGHLVLAPLAMQVTARQMSIIEGLVARWASGLPDDPRAKDARVVVVNAPDALLTGYIELFRDVHGETTPASMLALAPGTRTVAIERPDVRTLVVRVERGFYRGTTDRLTRSLDRAFSAGARVALSGVSIEIAHVGADGMPDEAVFRFDEPLESPSLVFRRWRGRDLVPFELPPVGRSVRIDAQSIAL